jgi:hypothetical protein
MVKDKAKKVVKKVKDKAKPILKEVESKSNEASEEKIKQKNTDSISMIPENFSEFGSSVDPTDKKVFVYGAKKFGKDTLGHAAAKGTKEYRASLRNKNFELEYDRKGDNKSIGFKFVREFSKGDFVVAKKDKKYYKDIV